MRSGGAERELLLIIISTVINCGHDYDYEALKYDPARRGNFPRMGYRNPFLPLEALFRLSTKSAFLYGRWSPLDSDLLLCDKGLIFANEGHSSSCFVGDQTDFRLQLYT